VRFCTEYTCKHTDEMYQCINYVHHCCQEYVQHVPAFLSAALLVNVNASMRNESHRFAIRCAMRVVSTFVLPLPAPATIISGSLGMQHCFPLRFIQSFQ
jgi:hypothetical protein